MHRSILVSMAVLVSALAAADANDGNLFNTMGAPAARQVEVAWNRFRDHAGLHAVLAELHEAFPGITELYSIGQSHEGRELWCLEVTNKHIGDPKRKTGMYIDGNIHGNEVQAGEVVLYTAWYLCENYGRVEDITKLVDERVFYLLPAINPDGRDYWFHGVQTQHSSRSGKKPLDNDRDGLIDEDDYDDLDGDGTITRMRIKDPNGRYKADPEYPEHLMVRAKADEAGEYTILGYEGIDNDGDGSINEDTAGGYDSNRNWGAEWEPPYVQRGAHDYPFSLPNTRAVADFVMARPNIAASQSYHNNGGMLLRGPGNEKGPMHPADARVCEYIGERGEMQLPNYRSIVCWEDLYPTYGDEMGWFYARGIIGFINELWTAWNFERSDPDAGQSRDQQSMEAIRYLLMNDGAVKWKPFDHPVYGPIEIGGFKKEFGRLPPSFLLEEECHRNAMFTLFHAQSMPSLEFGEVTVEALGEDLYKVWVEVRNTRLMSSRSGWDAQKGISPPDVILVEGENAKVLAGGKVTDPHFKKVTPAKARPHRLEFNMVPGMGAVRAQFVVAGSGGITITVDSAKGGVLRMEQPLNGGQ